MIPKVVITADDPVEAVAIARQVLVKFAAAVSVNGLDVTLADTQVPRADREAIVAASKAARARASGDQVVAVPAAVMKLEAN